jgi:hypothetical protein
LFELIKKLAEKFNVVIPYHRVYYGKKMALVLVQVKWNDSFHMLYGFGEEVEKRSPGSVVDIDYKFVRGRVKSSRGRKYKMVDKRCFRICFVCVKECWKVFLDRCSAHWRGASPL